MDWRNIWIQLCIAAGVCLIASAYLFAELFGGIDSPSVGLIIVALAGFELYRSQNTRRRAARRTGKTADRQS